jgi:mannose-6-phosphate isomerase
MFMGITNTPRDYAWGSRSALAELLGRTPSGGPEAEYWLGTHPGSPSLLSDPSAVAGASRLSDLTTLPFLLKVLAASAPLSLQAHPTTAQAEAGFARENAEGIALDAPNRNYKDAMHKPELIYALSAEFVALCGFREVAETRALLQSLGPDVLVGNLLDRLVDDSSLRSVFEWLISRSPGVDQLIDRVVALARDQPVAEFEMVGELSAAYPGDPGIVIALLLNRVVLHPGQVLYLPAGNIHAYLRGLGIELMAASDNVMRGGLTPKRVDVGELLAVLDFRPTIMPLLEAERPSGETEVFRPDVPDFELAVITPGAGSAHFEPAGEALLLCLDGDCQVVGARADFSLSRGGSAYVTADEAVLTFTGPGRVFVATRNRHLAL